MLGFGVHEGDWESVQIGLDADGEPDTATYAQHGDGERCACGQVERGGDGAPVVYVALASHASYFRAGVNRRGIYPDDYHRGTGLAVRPALEVVTAATPFLAWRGRWGASSSSPVAPRRQAMWADPSGFSTDAAACTVGALQARASARADRAAVPAPELRVVRARGRLTVRYRLGRMNAPDRPHTLLISLARADDPGHRRRPSRARASASGPRDVDHAGDGGTLCPAGQRVFAARGAESPRHRPGALSLLRVIAACALLGASIFVIWLALIAFGALCE